MHSLVLAKARECIARSDRARALAVLRSAIQEGAIAPRDGIELMLAARQGPGDDVLEAIDAMQQGKSGVYRFIPRTDHALA